VALSSSREGCLGPGRLKLLDWVMLKVVMGVLLLLPKPDGGGPQKVGGIVVAAVFSPVVSLFFLFLLLLLLLLRLIVHSRPKIFHRVYRHADLVGIEDLFLMAHTNSIVLRVPNPIHEILHHRRSLLSLNTTMVLFMSGHGLEIHLKEEEKEGRKEGKKERSSSRRKKKCWKKKNGHFEEHNLKFQKERSRGSRRRIWSSHRLLHDPQESLLLRRRGERLEPTKEKIICTVRSEGEDDTTRPNPGWRDPVASMSDRVWSVNSPPEDSPSVMLSASQARLGIVLRHQGRSDPVELKGNKGGERGRRWGVRRIGMREGKG